MATEPVKEYPQEVVRGTFFEHDVPISQMFVHFRTEPGGYARPLRPWRVNKLVSEWDQQALGALLLSMREDGTFAALDGQHRIEAAIKMGLTGMDAMVYIDLTLEDEARLYRKFGDYLKQTPLDKYHAGVAEGLPEYLAIQRVLNNMGLHVPQVLGAGIHGIDAVDSLVKVATIYRPEGLQTALGLLHDAWDGQPRVYRAITITGTAMFLARFQDKANFNRKRLVTRMQRLGLSTVERQAYTIRDANLAPNPHSGWGQALLQVHDKNQPEGHELGDWPKKLFSETQSAKLRENLKAITDAMTPEQRSAKAIKANANMTPAQRTARGLKGQKTRFGVTARDVICPYCHAIPGYRCKNGSGEFSNSYHQARINAASTQRAQATQ